jgi:iron complex outermembrane recepter protein
LLDACLAGGGTGGTACAPFSRQANGNLNPPDNFLANLGQITTSGEDIKFNWASEPFPLGHFSVSTHATRVNTYRAVDQDGNVALRAVGIEVNNSAIPRWRMNAQIGYGMKDLTVSVGAVNAFGKSPPVCYTCNLNGYDAGTYDLPGAFWNARLKYKF